MADPVALNVSRLLGSLLPAFSAVLLVMLVNLPVTLTGGLFPAPLLALTAVYFWALVRPDLMPPYVVLFVGLLEDLLSGGPAGIWATGFMAAYALVDRQRENLAGLAGAAAVLGFAVAMATAATATFVLTWIMYMRQPPLAPLLLASVFTALFYPPLAVMLGWVHRRAVGAVRMVR
jgi:rod shape-determining protein MreD